MTSISHDRVAARIERPVMAEWWSPMPLTTYRINLAPVWLFKDLWLNALASIPPLSENRMNVAATLMVKPVISEGAAHNERGRTFQAEVKPFTPLRETTCCSSGDGESGSAARCVQRGVACCTLMPLFVVSLASHWLWDQFDQAVVEQASVCILSLHNWIHYEDQSFILCCDEMWYFTCKTE